MKANRRVLNWYGRKQTLVCVAGYPIDSVTFAQCGSFLDLFFILLRRSATPDLDERWDVRAGGGTATTSRLIADGLYCNSGCKVLNKPASHYSQSCGGCLTTGAYVVCLTAIWLVRLERRFKLELRLIR